MSRNRKMMTKWFLVVALMLATVLPASAFAAAGDVTSITFDTTESNVQLTVNESTSQLRVLANLEGYSQPKDVTNLATWISSDSSIVKVEGGLLTPLKKGTVTITAKYMGAVRTIQATAKYSVDGLALDPTGEVEYKLGTTGLTIKAMADGTNNVTADATWASSDSSIVTVEKGQLTLVGKGTATITATYKGVSASVKVKVVLPYSKLSITPGEDQEMLVGDAAKELKVYAKESATDTTQGTDVTAKVTWSSTDEGVAKVVDGKLKPVALGKATIKATYLGSTTSIDVYVRNPYEALILGNQDFVKNAVLFMNESADVSASVRNGVVSGGSDTGTKLITSDATWTSSNPLAVTASGGHISAKAVGNSTVKVTYMGLTKEIKVTVNPTVTAFKADADKLELLKGSTKEAPKVTGTLLDNDTKDFSSSVAWTSSNESVATVDGSKVKGVEAGTAVLTGTIGSKKVAEIPVTVSEKVLTLLSEPSEYQLITGKTSPLPATVTAVFENGDEKNVASEIEWSLTTSNAVIKDGTIKGLINGKSVLKGTYSNETIKIPVTIEQEIKTITVDPTSVTLNLKKSKSIKVTGYYAGTGKAVNLSSKMEWKSSNEKVASVRGASVKAEGEGTAELSATYQGKQVKVTVNVVPKLSKLTVSEKKLVLAPGAAKTVSVTALFDTGKTESVTGAAEWTSSKPSVATVSNGQITAIAKGSASIKAKYGNKTVTISVSVKIPK